MTYLPFGVTITRLRAGASTARDEYGVPVPGPLVELAIKGCVVTPRQETPQVGGSDQQARDTVIVGWTVYAPHGTDITTTDRVRIKGRLYEVTGQPADWGVSPFTGMPGVVQFAADLVTG